MEDQFIERKIMIGLIVSDKFIEQISKIWNPRFLTSPTARQMAGWCLEYFEQNHKAPMRDIEIIYSQQLKKGIDPDRAEWMENVLGGLSDEYDREGFNADYLIEQTKAYFQERHLIALVDDITGELERGDLVEAENLATSHLPLTEADGEGMYASCINPFAKEVKSVVQTAFEERANPMIHFSGRLGRFWNQEFIRSGFLAFMGREKIGKTFLLMEVAFRGIRSDYNVAFFQAGDMTQEQQIRRFGIYLSSRSDEKVYCEPLLIPQVDCRWNQLDTCNRENRESGNEDLGISESELKESTSEGLAELLEQFPNHQPCRNCRNLRGAVWFKEREKVKPIGWNDAYRKLRRFGKKHQAKMKLSSHPNETLTVARIRILLDMWERVEGFVPDIVVLDYADLLAPDPDCSRLMARDQQNKIWQRLRALSQFRKCLVVTATQISTSGYEKKLIGPTDFSEDKRKLAHVTAMFGLNQDDEEKLIGVMRVNKIALREGEFNMRRPVTILQRLEMGRPNLGSY